MAFDYKYNLFELRNTPTFVYTQNLITTPVGRANFPVRHFTAAKKKKRHAGENDFTSASRIYVII